MDSEQERLLPIANVGRIMKQILPPHAKISKEAKQTMQECATEFVSFITGEAADKCHKENRKTVNGDDIYWALSALGFDNYADAMLRYLHKYREAERERANQSKDNCGGGFPEQHQESSDLLQRSQLDKQCTETPTSSEHSDFQNAVDASVKQS